ncbi:MAG: cobalt-precorrin-6A reductase [Alphaproteobacteria bacterium]
MRDRNPHLLILAGTAHAARLADAVWARFGKSLAVTVSLAGRTDSPETLAGAMRIGGFGGADGLAAWLRAARVDMVVDATHPYATRISSNARMACDIAKVPRLVFSRPPWAAAAGDRWREVPDFGCAAAMLPRIGSRIFLSIGSQKLDAFAGLRSVHLVVRMIDAPKADLPLADYSVILDRGPFCEAAEIDLLRRERVDAVVSRNSGGTATFAKIAAARRLRLPVVMIAPPPAERGLNVETIEGALQWVAQTMVGRET